MKKVSSILLFLGVLIAICVLIYSGHHHKIPTSVESPSDVVAYARNELKLPPDSIISVTKHVGSYYQLQADPSKGGGGMWILIEQTAASTRIIAEGQDYPECVPVEGARVPMELVRYCRTSLNGGYIKDRTSGLEATSSDGSL